MDVEVRILLNPLAEVGSTNLTVSLWYGGTGQAGHYIVAAGYPRLVPTICYSGWGLVKQPSLTNLTTPDGLQPQMAYKVRRLTPSDPYRSSPLFHGAYSPTAGHSRCPVAATSLTLAHHHQQVKSDYRQRLYQRIATVTTHMPYRVEWIQP